jgi:hypothetical protein
MKKTELRFEIIDLSKASNEELTKLKSLISKNLKECREEIEPFSRKAASELTPTEWSLFNRHFGLNQLQLSILERIYAMAEMVDVKEVLQ